MIDDTYLPLTLSIPTNLPLCAAEMLPSGEGQINPKLWDTWRNTVSGTFSVSKLTIQITKFHFGVLILCELRISYVWIDQLV